MNIYFAILWYIFCVISPEQRVKKRRNLWRIDCWNQGHSLNCFRATVPTSFQPLLIFFTRQQEVYSLLTERQKEKERKTERCQYPWGSDNCKRASHLSDSILDHWIKSTFHMLNYYSRVLSFYVRVSLQLLWCVRGNYSSTIPRGGKWVKAQQALEIALFRWSRMLVLWETEWHPAPWNQSNPGPPAFHHGRILLIRGIQQMWGPAGREHSRAVWSHLTAQGCWMPYSGVVSPSWGSRSQHLQLGSQLLCVAFSA